MTTRNSHLAALLTALAAALCCAPITHGQVVAGGGTTGLSATTHVWQELGPAPITSANYAGRISAVVTSHSDQGVLYVAGADGGVWRSDDGGAAWTALFTDTPTTSVGALALDPDDHDVIYAGTGEANYANHSRYGLGLLKSTDGGEHWRLHGSDVFAGRCFSRLVVSPDDSQTLFAAITRAGGFPELAAAKEHPGATGDLGVFRSEDGGRSWTHLAGGLPDVSATDLAIDPSDGQRLLAAIGRVQGDPGNGIWRSTNGGDNWTRVTTGLPAPASMGRISLAIAPSDSSRAYALIARPSDSTGGGASTLGAYRSDDGGGSWTSLPVGAVQSFGWYYSLVTIDPSNPDTVFFGGLSLRRSTNAGASFATVTPPHVDMHAGAWDVTGRLIVGDDGGVHRSTNLGNSWVPLNEGLGTVQFYAGLSIDPNAPGRIFGGTQDNGTNRREPDGSGWVQVLGGDGGWTLIDPTDSSRVFAEFQGSGNLYRSTNGGSSFSFVGNGIASSDRNAFLPPYAMFPTNSSRMLYGTHRVYRSLNGGSSWTPLSGDLTTGVGAIRALAISPADSSVFWVATNDGNLQISTNGGSNWQLVQSGLPGWPRTTREIVPHPTEPLTAYLAVAAFGESQVQRTTDGGQSWVALDAGLPDIPVNVVYLRPGPPEQLFAGTDAGLLVSGDDGETWQPFGTGLPPAPVIDIRQSSAGRMVVSTQGRGVWEALPQVLKDG